MSFRDSQAPLDDSLTAQALSIAEVAARRGEHTAATAAFQRAIDFAATPQAALRVAESAHLLGHFSLAADARARSLELTRGADEARAVALSPDACGYRRALSKRRTS